MLSLAAGAIFLCGVGCGNAGNAGGNDAGASDAAASSDDASATSDDGGTSDGGGAQTVNGVDASALVAECQALAMSFARACETELVGGVVTPDTSRACVWTTYAHICQTGRTKLLLDSMMCLGQNPSCWVFSDSNTALPCLDSVHAATPASQGLHDLNQRLCMSCDAGASCAGDAAAMYIAEGNAGRSELLPYLSDAELDQIATCATTTCPPNIAMNCASLPDVAGTLNCK